MRQDSFIRRITGGVAPPQRLRLQALLVLETIYAVFEETRDWPTCDHVERALDKHSW